MTDSAGNTLMSAAAGGAFVDRSAFRQALLTDMDVTWGKRFSRYSQGADGVTLHFDDGKQEVVDLLIAGDGANSAVRRQRAPAIRYEDLGFTNVAGIATLADVPRVIQEKALAGLTRWLGPDGHTVMMFGLRDLGLLAWVVSWPGTQGAWRAEFAAAGEDVEDEYGRSSQARDALQTAMVKRVRGRFQPEVAQVVAATLPAGTSLYGPRQIFSVDPKDIPSQLAHGPEERVFLLGDAAHATTTHRGLGANTAIQDAADLAAALSTQQPSCQAALQAYERGMVARGVRVATESRQSTQMIHATGAFATYVRPSMIRLFGLAMRAGLIKQE
jgi:2-polyprenyl-6-methoxyphenol hydroxylase-like FAD-dependent oxidoreductase